MAKINGTSGADILGGTESADQINGYGGDDQIDGGAGDDLLDGGEGNDTIEAGAGTDIVRGGGGDDNLHDLGGGGEFYGGDGHDYLGASRFDAEGVLLLDGGNDNDNITVGIFGGSKIVAKGGGGSDFVTVLAMLGTLEISLGTSRDVVTLYNGVFSGDGSRMFRIGGITITDFAAGNSGDVLDWDRFLGLSLTRWDQSANPFGSGHLRLVQSGSNTLVQIDLDGGGDGYQTLITLANVGRTTLTAANFDGYAPNGANTAGRTITGTDGYEELTGTIGDDLIRTLEGGGLVNASGGSDRLVGGGGTENFFGEVGHDLLEGAGGDDYLYGGIGNDRLFGGTGNDQLVGEEGDDFLDGGAGDDNLLSGDGIDELRGGEGNDSLAKVGTGPGRLDGGDGDDVLDLFAVFGASPHLLVGGAGNDRFSIYSSEAPVTLDAGAGNDRVEVKAPGDKLVVKLGSGVDTFALTAELGYNWGPGRITVTDFAPGPLGERIELIEFLTAQLVGWNGTSDPFRSGFARLTQSGNSTLLQIDIDADDFNFGFQTVATFANTLARDFTSENLDGFSPIPVRKGTGGANNMTGTSAAERIEGLGGNDVISARGGDDLLIGGAGDDVLIGEAGRDLHHGGPGNDVYRLDDPGDSVLERAGEGHDEVHSTVSFSLPDHVEALFLRGTAAIDGTGNDLANAITGNNAANRLDGGRGNDSIIGAGGNDQIYGNLGNDVLKGGVGADNFLFNTRPGSGNVDRIVDFSPADDTIKLARTVFAKAGANGVLAAGAFHNGTSAADAADRIVYDQATGRIYYDPDGTGAAAQILFATVAAGTALTHADFVIYG